jgi:hypothetical protein
MKIAILKSWNYVNLPQKCMLWIIHASLDGQSDPQKMNTSLYTTAIQDSRERFRRKNWSKGETWLLPTGQLFRFQTPWRMQMSEMTTSWALYRGERRAPSWIVSSFCIVPKPDQPCPCDVKLNNNKVQNTTFFFSSSLVSYGYPWRDSRKIMCGTVII